MAEEKTDSGSTWAQAAFTHLFLVGLSFILTILVSQGLHLIQGEAIDALFVILFVFHLLAAVVGVCLRRASVKSCILVFTVAFIPGSLITVQQVYDAYYMKFHAASDRFRDNLSSTIPKSVSQLRFVPLEEHVRPDLVFEFDIAPTDLDAILEKRGLSKTTPADLLNPQDYFLLPYYLPFENDYELFQGRGQYNQVVTLKVNKPHTHAVARFEFAHFYDERLWENGNPVGLRMEKEHLERLRQKHEANK